MNSAFRNISFIFRQMAWIADWTLSRHAGLRRAGIFMLGLMLSLQSVLVLMPDSALADTGLPTEPPAKICGNTSILSGPSAAPEGAVVVPAGDNSGMTPNWKSGGFSTPNKTFWFAPGVHTLGSDQFSQIQPGNNSTFIGAPGAIIDGQKKNNYAFTANASGVTIKYLTVRNFTSPLDEGVVNHDMGKNWTFEYNTFSHNQGGALFLADGNKASYNCLSDNGQYGFQGLGSSGTATIVLDHNEIARNNTANVEANKPGCGCSGGGKFWDVRNVRVTNNYVHDNDGPGLWADTNNSNFLFESNWIENNNGQAILYELSYNAAIRNNVMRHNLLATGKERIADRDNFPDAAIYLSESGGDTRIPYDLVGSPTIDVSGNVFEDNYNGIALWENADRYCGSPANSSTGYCTLVNPSVANIKTCNATNIAKEPYFSDCRWKTQNVKVHDNIFKMNPANFYNCKPDMCGRNAIIANYGTVPSWSPYKGDKVFMAITFNQGNVFSNNTYVGPWGFNGEALGDPVLSFAKWQAAPYNQDAGSSYNGTPSTTPSPTPNPQPNPDPTPVENDPTENTDTETPVDSDDDTSVVVDDTQDSTTVDGVEGTETEAAVAGTTKLPSTGIESLFSGLVGSGALFYSIAGYVRSRRVLLAKSLNV